MKLKDLPPDLFKLVNAFAWHRPFCYEELLIQLQCCIDCQHNIAPWFLEDVIYCFPQHSEGSAWTLKFHNPLVFGACYRPFDIRHMKLNRRTCEWLFMSLTDEYLAKKKMLRKPLKRILYLPIVEAWAKIYEKLGDITTDDLRPRGYMASLVTKSMCLHLPLSAPLANWSKLFALVWPHGLPSS